MSNGNTGDDERPEHEDPTYIDLVIGPGYEVDNERFGRMLAEFRQLAGLSRAAAANALDVSAEYIRLIELGRRTPAMGQMPQILELYGIEGEVGRLQPGGDRPDLILFAPQADGPTTIDFASRIRGARRRVPTPSRSGVDIGNDEEGTASTSLSKERAGELGLIVSLLVSADDPTLGEIRDLLERRLCQ